MKPYEIIKDIFIVGGPEITDSRDGCVYLLHLGELALIDSGAGWSVDKIIRNIESLGFDCKNLSKILLTHCHIDHIGGAPNLRKRFGSKVSILPEFGSNLGDWDRSTQKLLDLNADILCEGHFGIYDSKKNVKDYILSYRRQYGVE